MVGAEDLAVCLGKSGQTSAGVLAAGSLGVIDWLFDVHGVDWSRLMTAVVWERG